MSGVLDGLTRLCHRAPWRVRTMKLRDVHRAGHSLYISASASAASFLGTAGVVA